ncbi:F-type H+-transporting ATPase subunit delta [Candidatus Gastranaerophilus sp. (ex Termes propinquus)]|nr:F-type H+-transporting ATPase subunit delta [Candidatus Gastranaerophilus sp. (ex Termes propinquus)]
MPVVDIKNLKPAKRYAQALLELGSTEDALNMLTDLESIERTFSENPELRAFAENPAITLKDKKEVLGSVFGKSGVGQKVSNFLNILLEDGRINIFSTILQCFKDSLCAKRGIVQATVSSAVELNEDAKARLREALQEKLSAEINLQYTLDPSLIGGFSVSIQDKIIDLSVRSKLEQFRKLNKGT